MKKSPMNWNRDRCRFPNPNWKMNAISSTGRSLKQAILGSNPDVTIYRVTLLLAVAVLSFRALLVPIRVSGNSMAPNFQDGGLNFVNKWAYTKEHPTRGDVVAVRTADPKVIYIKRVIGLPGETVTIRGGEVTVNGKTLTEGYADARVPFPVGPMKLSSSSYFVIGDNREVTIFGPVPESQIIGKVLF